MISTDIVILAAGQGKRMRSRLPKVLQPLAGQALLSHVLSTARQLNAASIWVVYGHGGELVRARLDAPDLHWAEQNPPQGTGHAVQQAVPHLLSEQVLVLYGDVPLLSSDTLQRLLSTANSQTLALLTEILDNPSGYGRIVRDTDGNVTRIVEEKDAQPAEKAIREVNTGILVAPRLALTRWLAALRNDNAQGEYYLTDIIAMAVADGIRISTLQPGAAWETAGVNDKLQLARLERTWQQVQAERLLTAGVTLIDPARIDIRGSLTCGQDVEIDVNCVFEGQVELGDGVRVGAHCVLKNVKVAANTVIQPFCHLESAEVGPSCQLGPYARLRPGTTLADHCHIGNFVELKNTQMASASKANHLTYVGDATVGSRVNIGAGTITCNYDGVNKYRTVIEDDAFIGSDSQLVAPVTVGQGATLGAGTTLTKDAPPHQLTVSRPKQLSIAGWKKPEKIRK